MSDLEYFSIELTNEKATKSFVVTAKNAVKALYLANKLEGFQKLLNQDFMIIGVFMSLNRPRGD